MKKLFPKILISFLALVVFLAPLSSSFEKQNGSLALNTKVNVAEAQTIKRLETSSITVRSTTDNSAGFGIKLSGSFEDINYFSYPAYTVPFSSLAGANILTVYPNDNQILLVIYDTDNNFVKSFDLSTSASTQTIVEKGVAGGVDIHYPTNVDVGLPPGSPLIIQGLNPDTDYVANIYYKVATHTGTGINLLESTDNDYYKIDNVQTFHTQVKGGSAVNDGLTTTTGLNVTGTNEYSEYFGCGIDGWDSMKGCFAGFFYYIIFVPISWIGTLAGKLLDYFINYSTNSSSLTIGGFVSLGWAGVRDIANIFFIIALLYLAIETILGLGHDAKKMIVKVIIVALLINFSLFFTKVIIDSSNILAKVFYNHISIVDKQGKELPAAENGEKQISAQIMSGFDPQTIISADTFKKMKASESVGTYIFIVLIASAVVLYASWIFFSVAILFVSRIAMLCLLMIFAPIAYASYTLPFDIPGFGHKEWWKELLQNAFLAPVFCFLLYVIMLLITSLKGVNFINDNSKDYIPTVGSIMHSVVPFLIIVVLLMKSKEMAKKYAGEMGSAISNAAAVGGGLVLGGAALGTAFLGRSTIGLATRAASTSNAAGNWDKARTFYSKSNFGGKNYHELTDAQKKQVNQNVSSTITGSGWNKMIGKFGSNINQDNKKVEDSKHARHELDDRSAKEFQGRTWKQLTPPEQDKVREKISQDKFAQDKFGKSYKSLPDTAPAGKPSKAAVNAVVQPLLRAKDSHADHLIHESKEKQGIISSVVQGSRTGTFDVRNLSKLVIGEKDTISNKIATGITKAIAGGFRSGIKNSFNIQHGEGQGKFLKDLGHTISESLKGAKVHVDLSNVGHEVKEHGGGHGGGGGGHH